MGFKPLVWYCRPVENGIWAKETKSAFGAYTPCAIDSVVIGVSHMVLLGLCLYRIWLIKMNCRIHKFQLKSNVYNFILGLLSGYCAAEPLIRLVMGISLFNLDSQTGLGPFEIFSLSIEALAWCSMVAMLGLETKVYAKEFQWYVRFGIIYLLVGDAVMFNLVLSLREFYTRSTLLIYGSSIICQADRLTLSNINLDIPVGSLFAVVGGTGEGKTSLVSAMLGELPALGDSSVVIRGTVAYVPQISWIFNATVRENITFGSSFEPARYWRAIDVTAMQHDLDSLLGRDLTEIGERGVNISGGQKLRVSMARAVYSDSDVYIFDDPLSALDAHVGQQVFNKCIREELQRKTRVLVTNQLHFLPQVDRIILVSEGMVKEEGTFEELSRDGTLFQKLMENAGKLETHVGENADKMNTGNETSESNEVQQEFPKDSNSTSKRKKDNSVLIKQEERETGIISWNVL